MTNFKLFILGTALSFIASASFAAGPPPAQVHTAKAQTRSLAPVAWATGNIVSRNNSRIAVEVTGRLSKLVEVGTSVEQGQILAQIDDTDFRIQLQQAKASVENAQSRLSFLQSEVQRISSLAKKNMSAANQLDETVSQRDVARGELSSAKAQLAQAQQNLNDAQLRAPFTGLVTERLRNDGEYVTDGTAVLRLVDTQHLQASVYTQLTAYQFVNVGQLIDVDSPLGVGQAPVKNIVPVANQRSHLMEIRLDLSELNWPVGLNIRAAIPTAASQEVIAVPRDALILRRGSISIFRVKSDNTAEQVQVQTGIASGSWIQVIGDVSDQDNIIIRGAERLQPGQTVAVKSSNNNLISGNE